jgi:hypothetical protein
MADVYLRHTGSTARSGVMTQMVSASTQGLQRTEA